MAYPISSHVHSVRSDDEVWEKTKFLSMDDMVKALSKLLRTADAETKLEGMRVGDKPRVVRAGVGELFGASRA